MDYTPLTPVSKIQLNQPQPSLQQPTANQQPQSISERPLDRPTIVRPQRTSTVFIQNEANSPANGEPLIMMQKQISSPSLVDPSMMVHYQTQPPSHLNPQNIPPEQPYYPQPLYNDHHMMPQHPAKSAKKLPEMEVMPEKERIEVIPLNLEKPTGLEMGDFLPMKFQMMGLGGNTLGGCDTSRFAGFKSFGAPNDLSDAEVSNSILKGHESMMAALTNRGRQIEIIQKLWQNKDAKTGKPFSKYTE